MDRVRLEELLNRHVDGSLADPLRGELEQMLLNSPEARAAFWRFAELHSRIRDDFQSRPGRSVAADEAPPTVLHIDVGRPNDAWPGALNWLTQTGPISYMVATLVLCAMLLSAWAYQIKHTSDSSGSIQHVNSPTEAEEYVGRVTGMKDCIWSDPDNRPYAGSYVPSGRKYELTSGLLEITYTTGARVILEGPCTYTVDSDTGGRLQLGKLVARVEKKAASAKPQAANPLHPAPSLSTLHSPLFTISTPTAVVTDLGTEFGVEVSEDGGTVSHVFRGSVKVRVVGRSGGEVVLRADESAQVIGESNGAEPRLVTDGVLLKTPKFITRMPPSDSEKASDNYAELVLSMGPAVYYRMEAAKDENDGELVIDAVGNHHGRLLTDYPSARPYVAGRWCEALSFRGSNAGDAVIVSDFPKAVNDRLTVSAWVMANCWEGIWPEIAGCWGQKAGQFHIGLYKSRYELAVRIAQRDGELMGVREENVRFPIGVWQHVAFVVDATELRLYRNGVEVASAECRGLQPNPLMKSLGIGCKTDDTGESVLGKHWHGLIDELAIFNKALSGEEIFQLFEGQSLPTKKRKEAEDMGE